MTSRRAAGFAPRVMLGIAAVFLAMMLGSTTIRAAEPRVALVIGNSAYRMAPLRNPLNDARGMASVLRKLGFTVVVVENGTRRQMVTALRQFRAALPANGVGLFYYAGHGMQVKGSNYLVPIDANPQSEIEVEEEAVNLQQVLSRLEEAANPLNIVILDACRDNPFALSMRSAGRGLAQVDAPHGTLIAYATAPGRTAADGQGVNGLYTGELLTHIQTPGLAIEEVFKRVRIGVLQKSNQVQRPWEASSLIGDFYFIPNRPAGPATPALNAPPALVPSPPEAPVVAALQFADGKFDGTWTGRLQCAADRNNPEYWPARDDAVLIKILGDRGKAVYNPIVGSFSVSNTDEVIPYSDGSLELVGAKGTATYQSILNERGEARTATAEHSGVVCTLRLARRQGS